MRRPARQREAIVTIGLLLSILGSSGANAADAKLIAKCAEPAQAPAGATLTCDVRANGLVAFKDVKAAVKGRTEALAGKFEAFDPTAEGTTTAYLVQLMPNARRATLSQMGDAVVTFTDQRQGKRRFTAYTFANDLTLISDSGASKAEFVRQIIAIKPAAATVQLYKAALEAIQALTKESGDRKTLVILGDGSSDDTSYSHDQVVKAAKDAGIAIHVLGYYDDRAQRPNFQKLSRLAEDTGGYAAEVKQGSGKDLTKDIVTSRFVGELVENGGTVTADLKGASGTQTIVLTAEMEDGSKLSTEHSVTIPAATSPSFEQSLPRSEPEAPKPQGGFDGLKDWAADNPILIVLFGGLIGAAIIAAIKFAQGAKLREDHTATAQSDVQSDDPPVSQDDSGGELLRDAEGKPVIYGWLEALDSEGTRHPLRTTNVRLGRHRDNDICLQNDSISRRHAVLHYNADKRRFVITDLGGGNGVLVNSTRYKSRELSDGDTVELGDVRLRFRAESEFLA